jgi:hypothetical protein
MSLYTLTNFFVTGLAQKHFFLSRIQVRRIGVLLNPILFRLLSSLVAQELEQPGY